MGLPRVCAATTHAEIESHGAYSNPVVKRFLIHSFAIWTYRISSTAVQEGHTTRKLYNCPTLRRL